MLEPTSIIRANIERYKRLLQQHTVAAELRPNVEKLLAEAEVQLRLAEAASSRKS